MKYTRIDEDCIKQEIETNRIHPHHDKAGFSVIYYTVEDALIGCDALAVEADERAWLQTAEEIEEGICEM